MSDSFVTIQQQKSINTNPVVRQQKIVYKDFDADQGLYLLFLENYKMIQNQPFVIERVPENTDKSTADKKNYYCIDVKQALPKPIKGKPVSDDRQIMRGFVVQNPRQTVFFSATKSQGFLMLTKSEGQKSLQLRPFLCGSIIKKKPEDVVIQEGANEVKQLEEDYQKFLRAKGKMPTEMFMQQAKNIKLTRQKKEETEFYVDNDYVTDKKENQKLKQKKRKDKEDMDEGNIDNEDLFERDLKDEENED